MASSRKGRRKPQEDERPQFSFITFDYPSQGRHDEVRKEIRSHVTSRQHRIVRETTQKRASAKSSRETSNSKTRGSAAYTQDERQDTEQGPSKQDFQNEEEEPADEVEGGHEIEGNAGENASALQQVGTVPKSQKLLSVEAILRSARTARQASRTSLLQGPLDTIGKMLGHLRLNFPMVMNHYSWIVANQAPDFEKHFMPDLTPGSGAATLIPVIYKDPALMATAVLIAAGHMLAIRNARMSQNTARCIYQLRNFVIAHINTAIQDPSRALSDHLLCAVLIIATHEGFQGSVENYHIHMKGLVQMINMRGGLRKLEESHPFLKKLIIWQDTNVATIMRCKPYHLMAKESEGAPKVTPNPRLWLLMDAKPS